jgi:hypothetical protein
MSESFPRKGLEMARMIALAVLTAELDVVAEG